MSILSAFSFGLSAASGDAGASIAAYPDRYFSDHWWGRSAGGMSVTPETAKRLPVFFACVQKRATSIAMLPFKIYKDMEDEGRKLAPSHPLYRVLYMRPNHIQSAFEFKWMMESHLSMRGNAFAEIIRIGGVVDQLMPMHPDRVLVDQLKGSGRMRYKYSDPLTGTVRILMQEEVFHLRENPDVVGLGQSRIEVGCEALGLGLQRQDYLSRFLRNDATPGAVITGADFADSEEEDEFVKSVVKSRTGQNRGRPYLMPAGMDMKTLSVTPIQAQLIDGFRLSDSQICSMMGVLPHTIGIDAGKAATFNSTEQFNLMDVQQRVLPQAIIWEQAIQRCLIDDDSFYAKASVASLMRGDAATRSKFYMDLIGCGVMNPDEARELEDLPPIPDGSGKRFWNQLNWGLLNREPATTPPVPPGTGIPQDDDEEDDETDPPQSDEEDEAPDDEQAKVPVGMLAVALVEHSRTRAYKEAA